MYNQREKRSARLKEKFENLNTQTQALVTASKFYAKPPVATLESYQNISENIFNSIQFCLWYDIMVKRFEYTSIVRKKNLDWCGQCQQLFLRTYMSTQATCCMCGQCGLLEVIGTLMAPFSSRSDVRCVIVIFLKR